MTKPLTPEELQLQQAMRRPKRRFRNRVKRLLIKKKKAKVVLKVNDDLRRLDAWHKEYYSTGVEKDEVQGR